MSLRETTIFLFDVDGTLTPSRSKATPQTINMLKKARKTVSIGFVGGSDLAKQQEQMGPELLTIFDYGFPENGVSAYHQGKLFHQQQMVSHLGEDLYQRFINFSLRYMADIWLPIKRGLFVECRASMVNLSPIGRTCSAEERKDFKKYDDEHKVRKRMAEALTKEFGKKGMQFSIGGQISIDCFPKGWDKTYCLKHLGSFRNVYFFGDMVMPGGNDYEIFMDERVQGVEVKGPEDTIVKVEKLLEEIEKMQSK